MAPFVAVPMPNATSPDSSAPVKSAAPTPSVIQPRQKAVKAKRGKVGKVCPPAPHNTTDYILRQRSEDESSSEEEEREEDLLSILKDADVEVPKETVAAVPKDAQSKKAIRSPASKGKKSNNS